MIAKQFCAGVAALFMTLLFASSSPAAVTLSLSTASDLSNLNVGDTITFDVVLDGLEGGSPTDDLDALFATIVFDGGLLGTPTTPAPGAIVPDLDPIPPLDPMDPPNPPPFQGNSSSGQADASYDALFALSGAPIIADGVFFSFDVTAQTAGGGTIGFDISGTGALDTLAGEVVVNFSDVGFSISDTNAIPEPTSLLLWASLIAGVFGWSHRRKRRPPAG